MEHFLYICASYSAKICALAGQALMLALSQHTGEYFPAIILKPLEIVYNKAHPSINLHLKESNTRQVVIISLQEVKHDIVFRYAQLKDPRRREDLQPRIQAHLLSVAKKIIALLEYQGILLFQDPISFPPNK
jgi:hypothetical protein